MRFVVRTLGGPWAGLKVRTKKIAELGLAPQVYKCLFAHVVRSKPQSGDTSATARWFCQRAFFRCASASAGRAVVRRETKLERQKHIRAEKEFRLRFLVRETGITQAKPARSSK